MKTYSVANMARAEVILEANFSMLQSLMFDLEVVVTK